MIVFSTNGVVLTHCKIVPGNTATGIGSEFYNYTERTLAYTSGGTTQIMPGDWIVGATSSAKAEVVSVTLTSGTWAGGDAAGTFRIRSQHGTFQSENIKVAAGTNDATIAANSKVDQSRGYTYAGLQAKYAIVSVYAQTALCSIVGKPDQTALVGQPLAAGASWALDNPEAIRNFKCIDYTAGSASTVQVTLFF